MRRMTLLGAAVAGAIIFVAIGAITKRDAIYDWWRLHDYAPPAAAVQFADDTTMTAKARTLFYINHPKLEQSVAFNGECPNNSEKAIVLGCYHPNQNGIFLFMVNDKTLSGVEQVTAAHEMLHAAYRPSEPGRSRTCR